MERYLALMQLKMEFQAKNIILKKIPTPLVM